MMNSTNLKVILWIAGAFSSIIIGMLGLSLNTYITRMNTTQQDFEQRLRTLEITLASAATHVPDATLQSLHDTLQRIEQRLKGLAD